MPKTKNSDSLKRESQNSARVTSENTSKSAHQWRGALSSYLHYLDKDTSYSDIARVIQESSESGTICAIPSVRVPLMVSAAQGVNESKLHSTGDEPKKPLVIVTASDRECENIARDIESWWTYSVSRSDDKNDDVKNDDVKNDDNKNGDGYSITGDNSNSINVSPIAVLPAWETLPHERLSPRADTVAQRIALFHRLEQIRQKYDSPKINNSIEYSHDGLDSKSNEGLFEDIAILLMPIRSLLQPVVAGLGKREPLIMRLNESINFDTVVHSLEINAYKRTDLVMDRGEYAVRGGIIDIFPPTIAHPVRIEFFGDDIESIKEFQVSDQRTYGENLAFVWATPCREMPLDEAVKERAGRLKEQLPQAQEMLESLSQGIPVEGMESLLPVLIDDLETVGTLLPTHAPVIFWDLEKISRAAEDLLKTSEDFLMATWHTAAMGKSHAPLDFGRANFLSLEECREQLEKLHHPLWDMTQLGVPENAEENKFTLSARNVGPFRGKEDAASQAIQELEHKNYSMVITASGEGTLSRLKRGIEEMCPEVSGKINFVGAPLLHGFIDDTAQFAIITEGDLMGRTSSLRQQKISQRKHRAINIIDLKPGDYVVHEQHGVGKFIALEQRARRTGHVSPLSQSSGEHENKVEQHEYLVLEYAPSKRGAPPDKLYVPTDQMDQISKYIGADEPHLNKLGGSDWAQTKARAKKHVKEIAQDLVKLYSARKRVEGHAFSSDTPWQRELEDAFPFQETPDQLRTIEEVKADMEKPAPMDRLIAGDVGFGKTEIAIRAAFKAVQDGKQVAILAPTTLLVQQHTQTFKERFEGFPIVVAALSRFETAAQTQEIKDQLEKGNIDVVIGTHKLLNSSIKFKDLGLVVIDEEQRFGVEHKETLKALRTNVDVLSMSATPIPRTLEMAVTGIRQMSTLATPPEDRLPVLTYVGANEDELVVAAIRREILRGGQIFYVHNRINDISTVATHLMELLPQVRVGIAHGRMGEKQLDTIIRDFWEHKIDVLVCTTIIETGLDISNANTLIVDDAQRYGLSQLHQLRGRVGRSKERAYAYFLYDAHHPLTQEAHDRLATIAQNTALGSGYEVALRDLELRGTGNLLGSEQSGHINGVGFDLYIRMIADAIEEYRNPQKKEKQSVTIDLPVEGTIPVEYIESDKLRLEAYRKIASATNEEELKEVQEELIDRYGPIPSQVYVLFDIDRLRWKAQKLGITDIGALGSRLRIAKIDPPESVQRRMSRLYPGATYRPVTHTYLIPVEWAQNRHKSALSSATTSALSFDKPLFDKKLTHDDLSHDNLSENENSHSQNSLDEKEHNPSSATLTAETVSQKILDFVNQVLEDLGWQASAQG